MEPLTKEDIRRAFRVLRENNRPSAPKWHAPLPTGSPTVVGYFLRHYYSTLTDELREEADEILASNELVRKRFMEKAE